MLVYILVLPIAVVGFAVVAVVGLQVTVGFYLLPPAAAAKLPLRLPPLLPPSSVTGRLSEPPWGNVGVRVGGRM